MKNKYQDALDCVLSTEKRPYVDWHLSVEELQELVDKETPMKPINTYKIDFGPDDCGDCSKCESLVNYLMVYCYKCGQKLDWSDCNE